MADIQANDFKFNSSGLPDPTAHDAVKHIDEEHARLNNLLGIIFKICDLAGFDVKERIVLEDRRTGHIWR